MRFGQEKIKEIFMWKIISHENLPTYYMFVVSIPLFHLELVLLVGINLTNCHL